MLKLFVGLPYALNSLPSWTIGRHFISALSENGGEENWLWAFLPCRSSLLPGIDKTVYGSKVTVSPTEDSLLLRVLVRFSSLILIMKCVLPVCFQTICLICWWNYLKWLFLFLLGLHYKSILLHTMLNTICSHGHLYVFKVLLRM